MSVRKGNNPILTKFGKIVFLTEEKFLLVDELKDGERLFQLVLDRL